jgi:hypothetical protein
MYITEKYMDQLLEIKIPFSLITLLKRNRSLGKKAIEAYIKHKQQVERGIVSKKVHG